MTIENSTFTGADNNVAVVRTRSDVTVSQSTFVGNEVDGIIQSNGEVSVTGSILTDNDGADSVTIVGQGSATVTNSIVRIDDPYAIGNIATDDPELSLLGDFGGFTETMRPLAGSVAIDAGGSPASPPATDQRGGARVVGSAIDIGAVEVNAGTFTIDPASLTVDEADGTVTLTVTRSDGSDFVAELEVVTVDGEALAGEDFAELFASLTWADGELGDKEIVITLTDDDVDEEAESFTVALANVDSGDLVFGNAESEITIVANVEPVVPEEEEEDEADLPVLAVTGPRDAETLSSLAGLFIASGIFMTMVAAAASRRPETAEIK